MLGVHPEGSSIVFHSSFSKEAISNWYAMVIDGRRMVSESAPAMANWRPTTSRQVLQLQGDMHVGAIHSWAAISRLFSGKPYFVYHVKRCKITWLVACLILSWPSDRESDWCQVYPNNILYVLAFLRAHAATATLPLLTPQPSWSSCRQLFCPHWSRQYNSARPAGRAQSRRPSVSGRHDVLQR